MAETSWLSMSSAPKGKNVIVYFGTGLSAGPDDMFVGEAYHRVDADGEDHGWWLANTAPGDFDPSDQIYPIVWTPLPNPPVFEAARADRKR